MKMSERDQRPAVGMAHIVLETDRMQESARFMRTIGMRRISDGPQVSVYEMRGGTHLIPVLKDMVAGDASFDLMVDDLHATHQRFTALGLGPSPIETRLAIDHEVLLSANLPVISSHFSQATHRVHPHEPGLGALQGA